MFCSNATFPKRGLISRVHPSFLPSFPPLTLTRLTSPSPVPPPSFSILVLVLNGLQRLQTLESQECETSERKCDSQSETPAAAPPPSPSPPLLLFLLLLLPPAASSRLPAPPLPPLLLPLVELLLPSPPLPLGGGGRIDHLIDDLVVMLWVARSSPRRPPEALCSASIVFWL